MYQNNLAAALPPANEREGSLLLKQQLKTAEAL